MDVFHPNTGEVRSDGADGIACWFIDTDYNEESFFVRHAYFLGANDPYSALKTTLKAEIDAEAWATLNSDTSRAFRKPKSGRIAVKVINHLGDEVMKVFKVWRDGIPHRRHFHRQPRPADRRRAEGRQDDGLRPAAQSGQSGLSFHKLDKAKDKNFWSVRVEQRYSADRSQDGGEPLALLRRSSRQGL